MDKIIRAVSKVFIQIYFYSEGMRGEPSVDWMLFAAAAVRVQYPMDGELNHRQ